MNLFTSSFSNLKSRIPSRSRSAYICSRLFYKSVPASVRSGIVASLGRDWPCFCPVCEDRVPGFSPLPEFYFHDLESNGSDLRVADFETCNFKAYQCPHCGATDRDRLYGLYLANRLPSEDSQQPNFALLDIAPSGPLSAFIRRKFKIYYRTADRFMKNVDDRIDITSMGCYADNSFDAFICSHVLEHIEDDRKAMAELFRVLKPGGWGIAMAPICLALNEIREDFSKTSEAERTKYFGQNDHVRVYSRESFIGRLKAVGFEVREVRQDHFKTEHVERCGISPSSVLYIVEKPVALSVSPRALGSRQTTCPKLAILGGSPRFSEKLHVGRPNIGDKEMLMKRFEEILERRWLTNDGPLVREFEKQIISVTGAKHCISMCNATVALEIAIRALELRGEVILPSYTFVATAHALQWQEITPVFADIDPKTLNIDPACIDRLITPRTTGIIGVHVWGRPCDTSAIEERGRKYGLKVLFDAAHAFGCSHKGRMIGNSGECEVFSFHATKFLNSFEGGAIVTNNDALAEKIRWMRNFGFSDYDRVIYLGTNGKMTEVCAAMGLTSLESMDGIISLNQGNYGHYKLALEGIPGIIPIDYASKDKRNFHYVVVEVDDSRSSLNRDELVEILHAENVLARKYFWPGCHRMQPYKALFPNAGLLLPNTERRAAQMMVLPTGQCISKSDITAICDIIRSASSDAQRVKMFLANNRKVTPAETCAVA
jgi:dTDP-4-amino-4,6-dideoxygalactose transaminase/SAM-dependent methyltransferase